MISCHIIYKRKPFIILSSYIYMRKITISTTIDPQLLDAAKKRGILLTSALRLGLLKMMQMEDGEDLAGVNTRVNEVIADNEKMQKNISFLAGRVAAYSEQLEKMDAGILEKIDNKIADQRAKEKKK